MFYIGISLEKENFKVAVLKKEKKTITITDLQTFPVESDNVKQFYNLSPFHTGKKVHIVSGLRAQETMIRKLHLPLTEKRKIIAALPFQMESLIPFPLENVIICPLLKPVNKQMTSVTIIATLHESLSAHLDFFTDHGILADHVSCESIAMARFAKWQFPHENRIIHFLAHEQTLSCVLLEENEIILSQTISLHQNEEASLEIDKLCIFLKQKGGIDENTPWLLTGNTDHQKTLQQIFLGRQLQLVDASIAAYCVPIGLSLDALQSDGNAVQFRQKEFTPKHTERFRKKKMSVYFAACLSAALIMAVAGSLMLGKKQRILTQRLNHYLPSSAEKAGPYSYEELQQKLFNWEKSLSKQRTPFSFIPTVPKVSDVLAWLSTHPSFSSEDGTKKEGMEIKSVHYSLSKYPKIGETSSTYVAQLELEFIAKTPRDAREFHELLLKGDQIVNAKKEIKWQTQNQTYRASFDLCPINLKNQ